jgi:hypothetical protein
MALPRGYAFRAGTRLLWKGKVPQAVATVEVRGVKGEQVILQVIRQPKGGQFPRGEWPEHVSRVLDFCKELPASHARDIDEEEWPAPRPNMAGTLDLKTWILGKDAAQRLGISERTLRKMVAEGRLHPRLVPIAGQSGRGNYFYDPNEVETERVNRVAEKTHVVPQHRAVLRINGADASLERLPPVIQVPRQAEAHTAELPAIASNPAPATRPTAALDKLLGRIPITQKRYLTPDEAIALTGLGLFYIEAKLGRGLPIGPHGARVYRRDKLEKL